MSKSKLSAYGAILAALLMSISEDVSQQDLTELTNLIEIAVQSIIAVIFAIAAWIGWDFSSSE